LSRIDTLEFGRCGPFSRGLLSSDCGPGSEDCAEFLRSLANREWLSTTPQLALNRRVAEHSIGMFSRPLKSKPFMTLLAKRGKRLGGMGFGTVSRSWREIDFATEVIDHIQRKTGRRVVVPLPPDLVDHEDRRAMIQKGMLMPKLAKFV